MWKTRVVTPSTRSNVIYVTDGGGNIYSFPLTKNKLSLKLLRFTFQGANGLSYSDGSYLRYWDESHAEEYHDVRLDNEYFKAPPGGWFHRWRTYYVKVDTARRRDVLALEMMKQFQALTRGVTLYFEQTKDIHRQKIVAAIDFGSSFSGYAFSLGNAPTMIFTNGWVGKGMAQATEKAPTTLLLNPDRKFHSFGYEAEDKYALLVDDEAFYDWYYFRNFKMKLYQTKDFRRDTVLRDIDGKAVGALELFTMAIRYMKTRLLADIRVKVPRVKPTDIDWVITLPAIWSAAAKKFMREAAGNAGIQGDCLKLALEPEAGSLYCKSLKPDDMQVITGSLESNPFRPGNQYILLDLGGGTADLSVHEVLNDRSLRELHRATGSTLGASTVDEAFSRLLGDLVGPEVMMDFFRDHRQDYVRLMRDFEAKKRLSGGGSGGSVGGGVVLELPPGLTETHRRRCRATMEEAVGRSRHAGDIKITGGRMLLNGKVMQGLFQQVTDAIVTHIREIKADNRLQAARTIVLVGGFSESGHVKKAIGNAFPGDLVIAPKDPGLAILKGAVLMGHRPESIVERVAKYTYGINFARKPFDEGKDPPELKATRDGQTYCDDVFEKFVEINQPIRFSDIFTVRRKSTLTSKQSKSENLYTKVYASLDPDPGYCTESCYCVKIGEIVRKPPKGGWPDELKTKIEIKFGETDMHVRITEENTGIVHSARLNSL